MAVNVQVATLEGGELKLPSSAGKLGEVVLAMPMNRILAKIVRIPAESLDDPVAFVTPTVKAMSPYPDDPLLVSCETLRETEAGRIVLAAALPENSADDLATGLDEASLNVTRIDALSLGQLPELLGRIGETADESKRRVLLIASVDCLTAFVLDGALPVAVRAISHGSDMMRELMLLLMEAESFAGASALVEIVTAGDVALDGVDIAPVRALGEPGDPRPVLASRALDPSTLDILPVSWREVLEETRFKQKMKIGFGIAAAVWLLALTVFFAVPKFYSYKIDRLKDRQKEHRSLYDSVSRKREQVNAVKAISNHDYGCLETLRLLVRSMPAENDFVLSRWVFKRNDQLTFQGLVEGGAEDGADLDGVAGVFKNNLANLRLSEATGDAADAGQRYFSSVSFDGKRGDGKFSIRCIYPGSPEEER